MTTKKRKKRIPCTEWESSVLYCRFVVNGPYYPNALTLISNKVLHQNNIPIRAITNVSFSSETFLQILFLKCQVLLSEDLSVNKTSYDFKFLLDKCSCLLPSKVSSSLISADLILLLATFFRRIFAQWSLLGVDRPRCFCTNRRCLILRRCLSSDHVANGDHDGDHERCAISSPNYGGDHDRKMDRRFDHASYLPFLARTQVYSFPRRGARCHARRQGSEPGTFQGQPRHVFSCCDDSCEREGVGTCCPSAHLHSFW